MQHVSDFPSCVYYVFLASKRCPNMCAGTCLLQYPSVRRNFGALYISNTFNFEFCLPSLRKIIGFNVWLYVQMDTNWCNFYNRTKSIPVQEWYLAHTDSVLLVPRRKLIAAE